MENGQACVIRYLTSWTVVQDILIIMITVRKFLRCKKENRHAQLTLSKSSSGVTVIGPILLPGGAATVACCPCVTPGVTNKSNGSNNIIAFI